MRARGANTDSDKKATPRLVRDKSFEEAARHNLQVKVESVPRSFHGYDSSTLNSNATHRDSKNMHSSDPWRFVDDSLLSSHADPAKQFGSRNESPLGL